MNELVIPLIAIIGTFSALITYIFMRYTTRNKERMSLIEHGKEANIFREQNNSLNALKYGLLMVFAGVGFFIGLFFEHIFDMPDALGVLPMVFIMGGAGLIVFYWISMRIDQREDNMV